METFLGRDDGLSDHVGNASNHHGFLRRFLDTGFRTKWCGYWVPPYKILDYFGLSLNGVWLDSETVDEVGYSNTRYVFRHTTDSFEVDEKISLEYGTNGFDLRLGVENTTRGTKSVTVGLETGVDIRSKGDDLSQPENYSVSTDGSGGFTVSAGEDRDGDGGGDGLPSLRVEANSGVEFDVEDRGSKTHHPGDQQRCRVTHLAVHDELEPHTNTSFGFSFRVPETSSWAHDAIDHGVDGDGELGSPFVSCVESLKNLVYYRDGYGMVAGHPWFQSFWGRDTFWSLLGLIETGYFDLSREILDRFARSRDETMTTGTVIPSKITMEGSPETTERADTDPLFVIAADKLRRHSGRLTPEINEASDAVFGALDRRLTDGVVEHSSSATWMDTVGRETAVEVQSLWLRAAESADDPRRDQLRRGLEDLLDRDTTVNVSVPLFFGQVDETRADDLLDRLQDVFVSDFGATTSPSDDPDYDPRGYHTGSTWGLTSCWVAGANLRYGRYEEGVSLLRKTASLLPRDQPGALPETVDSETGDMIGCSEQAWSAGLFVHVIDRHLLGIEVDADSEKPTVRVDPVTERDWVRRRKRVGDDTFDLRLEDGEAEVLESSRETDLRTQ